MDGRGGVVGAGHDRLCNWKMVWRREALNGLPRCGLRRDRPRSTDEDTKSVAALMSADSGIAIVYPSTLRLGDLDARKTS